MLTGEIVQRTDGSCLLHPADAEPLLVPDDSQMSDSVLTVVIAHLRQRGYIVIDPLRVTYDPPPPCGAQGAPQRAAGKIAKYNQHACPLCERPNE